MKKIYLGAFVSIFSVGMSVAQVVESPYALGDLKIDNFEQISTEFTGTAKALGVTFWTEDFSGGLGSWTIDNDGQAGGSFGWSVDSSFDGWWNLGAINSTSGGNYAELANGNPITQPGTQVFDVTYTLTSPAIDIQTLAGTDQITLTFEEYGARFLDLQEVQVSTDGMNFTPVRNNLGYSVLSTTGGSAYGNPELVSINLANYISNATDIYIRFSWTTNATDPTLANSWVTYGWFIDDIALTTNADNNMTAESSVWGSVGLNYSKIPLSQQTAIEFTTNARNNGSAPQTDVQLVVDVTGAATTTVSSPTGVTIAPGAYDSLVSATFTPSGLGTYNVSWGVTQNEVEDIPVDNDNEPISFEVTDFTYARDAGTQEGTFTNDGDEFVLGNYYDVFANDVIYSVDIQIGSNAAVGSELTGRVYSLEPSATTLDNLFVLEDQSAAYTLTSSDLGSMINLDLIFNGNAGFALTAGETYFIAVQTDGDNGLTEGVTIGTTSDGIPRTCFVYLPTAQVPGWYFTLNTPMVRMNLDPASNNVSLEEQSQLFGAEVFPNPATDNVSVRYIMGVASEVTITVTDITGKVVAEFEEGTQTEGAHELNMNTSAFAEGVYYVTIASGNSILSKKVVKK